VLKYFLGHIHDIVLRKSVLATGNLCHTRMGVVYCNNLLLALAYC